jgi:peroxiredoxin Q/BCP
MQAGKKAPDFKLKDKDGIEHKLSTLKAKSICLFFYPKDNTPGCTIEAKEFSSHGTAFKKQDCLVIGISGGDEKSKAKFCDKNDLAVLLLSDPTFETAKAYDTFGEKKFMGRTYNGIFRRTFILGSDRTVLKVFDDVKPAGHAQEVLAFVSTVDPKKAGGKRGSGKISGAKKRTATKKA